MDKKNIELKNAKIYFEKIVKINQSIAGVYYNLRETGINLRKL